MYSGAPRTERAVAEACSGARWATWNVRALSHSDMGARGKNVEFVRKLAAKTPIRMLQETRAREYGLRQVLRSLEASRWILPSGDSDSACGVAILVSKTLSGLKPLVIEHLRGRIWEARVHFEEAELELTCVHNFGIGNGEMRRFSSALHLLADAHSVAPMHRRAILMGDVNFSAARTGSAGAATRRADRMLSSALERWVKLPPTGSTHVSANRCTF